MELSGAKEGTKLLKMVAKDLNIPANHLYGWTDSQVVLGWFNKSNHRWKQFVSARVQFIIDILPFVQWRYVSSRENPADYISRGLLPSEIIQCRLWWKGPPWLSRLPTEWPAVSPSLKPDELPEARAHTARCQQTIKWMDAPWKDYSSYTSLIRVYSWIHKFLSNCRKPRLERKLQLTLGNDEIESTILKMTVLSQSYSFPGVVSALRSGKTICKPKVLASLSLFTDQDGLVRVGG